MKQLLGSKLARLWVAGCLLLAAFCQNGRAQCLPCGEEQRVVFKLRGVGMMAGSATARITLGGIVIDKPMVSTNAVVEWNPNTMRYEPTGFECVQWDAEVTVDPKLNEPVKIEYLFETDDQDPDYTEFEQIAPGNPITYWTRPSSACLKIWFDQNDDQWVPASDFAIFTDAMRMKGTLESDDSNLGDSRKLIAGGGMPVVNDASLTDTPAITNDLCASPSLLGAAGMTSGSTPAVTSTTAGKSVTGKSQKLIPRGQSIAQPFLSELLAGRHKPTAIPGKGVGRGGMMQFQPVFDGAKVNTNVAYSKPGKANVRTSGTPEGGVQLLTSHSLVGSNGVSIADPIGRLRWEMSLGSAGRAYSLGNLIYQANALDATAYSPARLRLASGSAASQTVTDTNGFLRQILVSGQLVDIPVTSNGFQVVIYPSGQFGAFDSQTGLFPANGTASLAWLVENPDASPMGKVRFTKTQGTNSEVHEAQWQGTAGDSGTMTILRFGGKWKDETEYSLNSTQRIETVSSYQDNVLQRKVREVYQEFYNWGAPGDIYEGLVQRVEDPDTRALTTTYQYWDSTNQPGNLLFRATYPDGYAEQIPNRISGSGLNPVIAPGDPVRQQRTYKDNDAGTSGGETVDKSYTVITAQFLQEETVTTKNSIQVGYRLRFHDFNTSGVWGKITYDSDGAGAFTYEEEWLDLITRKTLFALDRAGNTRTHYHGFGYWNPATQTLDGSPSAGTIEAFSTTIVHGTIAALNGIANKTTVNVMVEDRFGHTVLEETYVSDGTGTTSPSRLIDRRVHTYTDSRLTATHANGRLVYQASHLPDGLLDWEEDETGRRTEFSYDEMDRMSQMIVRGRGGDADRVTTFDYDAAGRRIAEVTVAGGLTNQTRWVYNLAGELTELIGPDGLTNTISASFTSGYKVTTETLPTGATRITSFFKDRQPRNVTGTAVEDEFYSPAITQWSPGYYREGVSVYRDSGLTQLKLARQVNWLGNEVLAQTPQFKGIGLRERVNTYDAAYDSNSNLITRALTVAVTETGRAKQLFTYDDLARLSSQGLDLNTNGVLDAASVEPITSFSREFVNTNGVWQDVSEVWRYLQDNAAVTSLVQRARVIVPATFSTNLLSSNLVERTGGGTVITTVELNHSTGELTTTVNDLELGQVQTRVQRDGLVRSELRSGIATPRTYDYTALGELLVVNDPVTGSVTNTYDAATRRLLTVTDSLNRTMGYNYYTAGTTNAGRLKGVQDAAGNWTYFDYTTRGQKFRQWGVNTYPVEQRYDEAGRMTNLMTFRTTSNVVNWASVTWPNPPAGDVTTWVYDHPSGLLERKVYADAGTGAKAVVYSYDASNFPDTKVNGRGQTIDYSFDRLGRMTNVAYSDGTPAATMSYDRAGRLRTVTDAAGTRVLNWTDRGQAGDESYTNGLLSGVTVTRSYDAASRLSTLGLSVGGTPQTRQRFGYDSISWLDYIADESPDGAAVLHQFDYTFKTNTPLVESVAFLRGTTAVMTNRYSRDGIGRLTGVNATLTGGASVSGVNYQLDALDRRYQADLADGTRWDYGYNARSEVTSGKKKLASGAFEGGKQFEYGFDDIGNRTKTKAGGDATGANLRESLYTANALNELVSREVPGSVWLSGEAPTNLFLQGVADGHEFTVERQEGERFFAEAQVMNDAASVYVRVTVAGKTNGVLNDVESGEQFVARDPEAFAYDDDGNLTQDGRWLYAWDAENRLVSVTARADIPDAAKRKVEFVYDFMGRRVQKIVSAWNGSTYTAQSTNRFVYDGWNLLAILDPQSSILQSFTWGLDLSGTVQGAGGVGGLLQASFHGATTTNCYATYDGNGNVTALVNAADGSTAAEYEYGPFGELVRESGLLAKANPFRFSTKYQDDETGLLYYGYRYYEPYTGRWLSRDPIGEDGGVNLYGFVFNSANMETDYLGLDLNINPMDPRWMQSPYNCIRCHVPVTWQPSDLAPGIKAVTTPLIITVQVAAIGGEVVGGTVLLLTPEPTMATKVGAGLLYADAVDRIKTLLTGEGYFEAGLEAVYGADNPYINKSLLIKDIGIAPLAGGSLLPVSAQQVTVSHLPGIIRNLVKDKPCEVKITIQTTSSDLHAFGNKAGPRPTRPLQDFGVGSDSAVVGPQTPPLPKGMSTFGDVNEAPLSGHYHTLPEGSKLPPSIRVVADGPEVVPNSPHPPTHHTFYPVESMTVEEFNELMKTLNWNYGGKK